MEVCQSLQERDGFPPGYGIRLLRIYLHGITLGAPPDTLYASYESLLEDPVGLLRELSLRLPLVVSEEKLGKAVDGEMRHQIAGLEAAPTALRDYTDIDFQALDSEVEKLYPIEQTLSYMASKLVDRGIELTRIGEAHAKALQTLDNRDADLAKLSGELDKAVAMVEIRDTQLESLDRRLQEIGHLHTEALAILGERDKQLKDFDRRLQEIGELHTRALNVIEERDAQVAGIQKKYTKLENLQSETETILQEKDTRLQRIFRRPVVGLIFRAMWKYETR